MNIDVRSSFKKRPAPQDLTLRNLRAAKKRIDALEERLGVVESVSEAMMATARQMITDMANLTRQFTALEEALAETKGTP